MQEPIYISNQNRLIHCMAFECYSVATLSVLFLFFFLCVIVAGRNTFVNMSVGSISTMFCRSREECVINSLSHSKLLLCFYGHEIKLD